MCRCPAVPEWVWLKRHDRQSLKCTRLGLRLFQPRLISQGAQVGRGRAGCASIYRVEFFCPSVLKSPMGISPPPCPALPRPALRRPGPPRPGPPRPALPRPTPPRPALPRLDPLEVIVCAPCSNRPAGVASLITLSGVLPQQVAVIGAAHFGRVRCVAVIVAAHCGRVRCGAVMVAAQCGRVRCGAVMVAAHCGCV